jgi:hypothetical protein
MMRGEIGSIGMIEKWIDAVWSPFVTLAMTAAYITFVTYGWTHAEAAAFASFVAFGTALFLSLIIGVLFEHLIRYGGSFDGGFFESLTAMVAGAVVSVSIVATWPTVTIVSLIALMATASLFDQYHNSSHGRNPMMGDRWAYRKLLLPLAIFAGYGAYVLSQKAAVGGFVCSFVLAAQFTWTVLRWPRKTSVEA